ncbi:TRAP transporter large permease subunit [Bacteroidota bacterium]
MVLGGLILMMLTGLPVAFAFMLVNLVAAVIIVSFGPGLRQLIFSMESSITSFTLVPIPMFILMGEVMFQSGIAIKVLDVLDKWMGRLPGRLSLLAIGAGTLFSTLSGSTLANTAMLGTVLAPDMKKRGYSKALSLGPIMGGGGLAMIIPPSALAVILGSIAQISVAQLLVAGIIPGLILAVTYAIYIIGRCTLQPGNAPSYEVQITSIADKFKGLLKYVIPLGAILFLVLGLIFLGIATPSESAALGALGSIILVTAYGRMGRDVITKSLVSTAQITVMLFMIVVGATLFSQLLAYSGATRGLVQFVLGKSLPTIVVIIFMQLILLFLGTFMEQVCMMMVTLPLYIPIVTALHIDPIWFGLMMLINLEVGLLTPPFGLILFVMKGVASGDVTMGDIYRAAFPFVICDLLVIAMILALPQLATWLPRLMLTN